MCIAFWTIAMNNRKAATEVILKWLEEMIPGGKIVEDQRRMLEALSDEDFDKMIEGFESGEETVRIAVPNLGEDKLDTNRLLATCEKIGLEPFQHLWLTDAKSGVEFRTNEKYLVVHLPLRRQQQALVKKISIPDSSRHIDEMTGQVTGDSKGASLSAPEIQILRSQELDPMILEFIKVRGGDEKALRAAKRQIIETGTASLANLLGAGTSVKSTTTLSILLTGMHLQNNLRNGNA